MPDFAGGEEKEKGVTSVVFAVVICTLFLFVVAVGIYIVIADRLNGMDAYRNKALRDQRDGYKLACEDNAKRFAILQKYAEQQGLKPSPDLMVVTPCTQPEPPEMAMK